MSPEALRRILWSGLLLLLPLPMLGFDAFVPVLRYGLLALVCVAMRVAEGPGGVVWQMFALFLAHALVYAGLLWLVAWLLGRGLGLLPPAARSALLCTALGVALLWATAGSPYRTPFGTSARTNLPGLLQ